MKYIPILLFTCFTGFVFGGDKILPYEIHQKQMPNGLNVVTVPYDSPGLASFYVVVRVGSREEVESGKTGFAHFFEHMMFRGTDKYPNDKYSEILKSTGASANANTSLDRTVYHMTGNAAELETMFDLESDRFQHLKYSVQDFKTEAGAVKGEYTKNNASPYSQLNEATSNSAFDKHTYKHTTMGFIEDIVDMPNQYKYSLEFFDRFYRPEYCTLIVVGDVKPEQVNLLAEKYFGNWKKGKYKADIPVEPVQQGVKYAHVKVPNFPPYMELNYKGPAYSITNNDYQALSLLGEILFSERSELYKKLVINDKKLRSLSGDLYPTRDPYLFSVSASFVNQSDMKEVQNELQAAIEKFKTAVIDDKLLTETKQRMRYSFAMGTDSPDAIANAISTYVWLTGDPESLNKNFETFNNVTVADMKRVAAKYLNNSGLTIGTISSEDKSTQE